MISNATMSAVRAVITRHVPLPTAQALFRELESVDGNKSFRDSVAGISAGLMAMQDSRLLPDRNWDEVLKVTNEHVIRFDGRSVYVHRVVDGREQQPNGYLLGANMTEVR